MWLSSSFCISIFDVFLRAFAILDKLVLCCFTNFLKNYQFFSPPCSFMNVPHIDSFSFTIIFFFQRAVMVPSTHLLILGVMTSLSHWSKFRVDRLIFQGLKSLNLSYRLNLIIMGWSPSSSEGSSASESVKLSFRFRLFKLFFIDCFETAKEGKFE